MTTTNATPVTAEPPATLLFVDDEQNILASLKRLFRPLGYRIFTATSGAEGLTLLTQESVDVVVSDMRMPEMDGAAFLEQVAARWPDTVRILLTGYADINSTVNAINKGNIYKYISKPWEDNDLKLSVQHALERKFLAAERQRLLELTRVQNEELKVLNSSLEDKVKERTEELRQTMGQLEKTHDSLKKSYMASVKVFASLIETRMGDSAGHARRTAADARRLAKHLGLNENAMQDLVFAALLQDIGKTGLPDALLNKPTTAMSSDETARFEKHPIISEGLLMTLEPLQNAATIIRSRHEQFDASGYPSRLAGKKIPLGARILAVAADYDRALHGLAGLRRMSSAEAYVYLKEQSGKRYDPDVVKAYLQLNNTAAPAAAPPSGEYVAKSDQLKAGMVLARDIVTDNGLLMLSAGYLLDDQLIQRIRAFEQSLGEHLRIYVNKGRS